MAGARVAWTRRRPPGAGRAGHVCEARRFFWVPRRRRAPPAGAGFPRAEALCAQPALCPLSIPRRPGCDHSIFQPGKQAPQAE